MQLSYTPPNSLKPFISSNKFISLVMGPVGSGKTSASLIKIGMEAAKVHPCEDGIRRSRCAVIRNTRQMLWDTTIPDFLKWYPDGVAGILMRTESKFFMKFANIECEVLFRGLDETNDVRRLLSLQLTFGMMDEFREINPEIYNALTGRLGRYPDKMMVPPRPEWGVDDRGDPIGGSVDDHGKPVYKVWGASNPPDADTFWEEFINTLPDNVHVTIQPSGLAPEADWVKHLPSGYYENLREGKSEDWIDVYIHGKFGKSLQGQPVFRCFNRETHVAKERLLPQPTTVLIGVDAGLTPAAVITQQTHDGRVLVLDAVAAFDMGSLRFVRERLKPLLANKYPRHTYSVVIDPAAFQRAQTDERSVADIYKAEGFKIVPARTNTISARIASVEAFMTRTVNGNAAFLIDPECKQLVKAMANGYRYKINTKGEKDEKPDKNEYSHISDALQYACLAHDNGGVFGGNMMSQRREMKVGRAVGWT